MTAHLFIPLLTMSSPTPYCNTCKRSPPEVILLLCTNSSQTTYCSRLCEDTDLATHQTECDQPPSPLSPLHHHHHQDLPSIPEEENPFIPSHPLPFRIGTSHTRLLTNKYLRNLPQQDVFTILTDTYRLHLHEQFKYGGPDNNTPKKPRHHNTPQPPGPDTTTLIIHFITLASCRLKPNPLLPPWWSPTSLSTLLDLASCNLTTSTTALLPDLPPETKDWLNLTTRPAMSKEELRSHYYYSHSQNNHQHEAENDNVQDVSKPPGRNKPNSIKRGDFILQLRYLAQVIYGCPTTGGISFKPTIALLAEIEKRKGWVEDRRFWEYLRS